MVCEKCQTKQAQVHLQVSRNGQKKQYNLCSSCYAEERQRLGAALHPSQNSFSNFSNFPLEDLFGQGPNKKQAQENIRPQTEQGGNHGGGFIDQFGSNLTQMANAGLIDPVIGRDKEVNRVLEILNRRNKNNPVLIGEPGVGKTAIAEALALQIVQGKSPKKMRDKEVYLLDVASLVANTGVRGQFEERMKQLMAELQQRKNIILFIDEIHLLVGAGAAEGSMDAGNILKPALARGELQVIGATTLKEYRHIEKDAALERRFQPVHVHEPSPEDTIDILRGLKEKYEQFHHVTYTEEAIRACVDLSSRYIQDRFLPDKAIDLLDEAGSKVNLRTNEQSDDEIERRLQKIHTEKEAALKNENYETAARLRDEEDALEKALQEDTEQLRPKVDHLLIQEIVEEKTRIPVSKLQEEERSNLQSLEEKLGSKVVGQKEAVEKIAKAIRRSRAGLKAKDRPIGSFLFVGPTGVGKTELTKTLAEQLFGSKEAMIRLDMSEYMEKHSVSKIIGSPPGYVGHDDAGQLTEQVRHNPYSIILLDEIEKAHPDVQHMFLQILEDGRLTDSQGRTVVFKDTVIIMTSNAGTGQAKQRVGFEQSTALQESHLLDSLGDFFKPEFLNRFDNIIEFNTLTKEHLLTIIELMLGELSESLAEKDMTLSVAQEVKEKISELGYHPSFGARPLRRVIQEKLEDTIADFILDEPEAKNLSASLIEDEIVIQSI